MTPGITPPPPSKDRRREYVGKQHTGVSATMPRGDQRGKERLRPTLMMEAISSSETSVQSDQTTLCHMRHYSNLQSPQ
jgi:hypothetical protein